MMKCYKCGKEIPDDARFCTKCGAPQQFTEELINRALGDDQDAFTQLYYMTKDNVYYTVSALVKDRDAVEDIIQDTYIRAKKALIQLEKPGSFRAWIKRIAHNLAVDYLRRTKPQTFSSMVSTDSDEMIDFKDDRICVMPDEVMDQKETVRLMGEILGNLPEEQRLVIGLFYYEQLSVKEIADMLDVSEGTIKSRLNYGRNKIKAEVRALEKKGTKLYTLAPIPFLLWLFRSQEAYAAELPDAEILQAVWDNTVPSFSSSSGQAAGMDRGGAHNIRRGSEATKVRPKAAKTGAGMAGKGIVVKSIAVKSIAGLLAVAVVGTGVAAAVVHSNNSDRQAAEGTDMPFAVVETIETQEQAETVRASEESREEESETAPLAQEEETLDLYSAYRRTLDAYRTVRNAEDEREIEGILEEQFVLWGRRQRQDINFYYAYYDIDGNGADELLIGYGSHGETRINGEGHDGIYITDLYGYNEGQAVRIFKDMIFGERANLTICSDGTMIEENSGGATYVTINFYRLSPDGYTASLQEEYIYDSEANSEFPYSGPDGAVSDEEFSDMRYSYTDIRDEISWILLDAGQINVSGNLAMDDLEGRFVKDGEVIEIVPVDSDTVQMSGWWTDSMEALLQHESGLLVAEEKYYYREHELSDMIYIAVIDENTIYLSVSGSYEGRLKSILCGEYYRDTGDYVAGDHSPSAVTELKEYYLGSYSADGKIFLTLYIENGLLKATIGDDLVMGYATVTYTDWSIERDGYLVCICDENSDIDVSTYQLTEDGSIRVIADMYPEIEGVYTRQ